MNRRHGDRSERWALRRAHAGHMPDNYLSWLVLSGLFGIVMVTVGSVSDPSHGPLTAVGVVGLMPSAVVILLWGIHVVKDD